MTDKDLYGGLIRLHILHHAAEEPVFGLGIIEELRRHGYEMSAGTVYPMLHGLEKKGYLTSRHERTGRRERRVYDITGHCCKVSDEAAFCLIQRPYISKTLLTRRISPRGSP
ncbi:PadR family transcriptional regulator (plasmid) [Klebsiella pneumoniae]|uniref:PadR family transcriptional regulator n=2 Tax=Enterobacteriaceae TaxID=543 RepID=UPI0029CA0A4D|nr:PadR family transcriptional regulator [Klebsiella pneumoniae]WPH85557.1 PadR family transcriptional regulator [Klebsiella pneumoniae]